MFSICGPNKYAPQAVKKKKKFLIRSNKPSWTQWLFSFSMSHSETGCSKAVWKRSHRKRGGQSWEQETEQRKQKTTKKKNIFLPNLTAVCTVIYPACSLAQSLDFLPTYCLNRQCPMHSVILSHSEPVNTNTVWQSKNRKIKWKSFWQPKRKWQQ